MIVDSVFKFLAYYTVLCLTDCYRCYVRARMYFFISLVIFGKPLPHLFLSRSRMNDTKLPALATRFHLAHVKYCV